MPGVRKELLIAVTSGTIIAFVTVLFNRWWIEDQRREIEKLTTEIKTLEANVGAKTKVTTDLVNLISRLQSSVAVERQSSSYDGKTVSLYSKVTNAGHFTMDINELEIVFDIKPITPDNIKADRSLYVTVHENSLAPGILAPSESFPTKIVGSINEIKPPTRLYFFVQYCGELLPAIRRVLDELLIGILSGEEIDQLTGACHMDFGSVKIAN
jgi:hypothetical protein